MATERTLSIIKPDAVSKNIIGKIISRFEDNGLHIVAGKLIQLDDEMASVEERIGMIIIMICFVINVCMNKL